jgi:C4-dicarboxylate-specific signal transduction histidine kinase
VIYLRIEDLVEDALRLNSGVLDSHSIKLVREYAETQPLMIDKHKVLQILVNLIRNAKHSFDDMSGIENTLLSI